MNFCQVLCRKFRPISTSLSPNTQWDDVLFAIRLLFQPWRWQAKPKTQNPKPKNISQKSKVEFLEEEFGNYLGVNFTYSFNSGRSSLVAILHALGIKKGDEVLIQAFTCNAVPNPIIWAGVKPVYVDIDETLNIDPEELERKITIKSKAIIVQHTFGHPAQMDKLLEISRRHNLYVIEDCAHSLGAEYNLYEVSPRKDLRSETSKGWWKVGTMGDIAFFSFGRDKVISSVYGGMVATNNPEFAKKIEEFQQKLPYPTKFWVFQQILHPVLFNLLILPLYNFFGLGKFLLIFLQKINLLSKAVTKKEKAGEKPSYFPARMPEALTALCLHQFQKLEKFNDYRRKIVQFYERNLIRKFVIDALFVDKISGGIYWRYPILVNNSEEIIQKAKKIGIFFDDGWRGSPVVPQGTDLEKMGYKLGSCPKAERMAKNILCLPTHINISKKDVEKIINFLNKQWKFTK